MEITSRPDPDRDPVTRRQLLGRSALLLGTTPTFAALLSACGGDDEPGSSGASRSDSATTSSGAPSGSGKLDFVGFEGDDFPNELKAFEKSSDITPKASYVGINPDILAKFSGGGGKGIDLISMAASYTPSFVAANVLSPIDVDTLPNFADVFPKVRDGFKQFTQDGKGNWVSIPFQFQPFGISYDSSEYPSIRSWQELLDPKYKGKIIIADFPTMVLMILAQMAGVDAGAIPKAKFGEIQDLAKKYVAQAHTVVPSIGDAATLLGSGEAPILWDSWPLITALAQGQGNPNVTSNSELQEGRLGVFESYGIPPGADNRDAALAIINEVLSPEIQGAGNAAVGAVPVVKGAEASVPDDKKKLLPSDFEAFYADVKAMGNPPLKSTDNVTLDEWLEAWQTIKAGA